MREVEPPQVCEANESCCGIRAAAAEACAIRYVLVQVDGDVRLAADMRRQAAYRLDDEVLLWWDAEVARALQHECVGRLKHERIGQIQRSEHGGHIVIPVWPTPPDRKVEVHLGRRDDPDRICAHEDSPFDTTTRGPPTPRQYRSSDYLVPSSTREVLDLRYRDA